MKVRMGLAPLQFSDSDKNHTRDIERILDLAVERKWAWVFGTEAGPGAGNTGKELIRVAREHNYKPWVPSQKAKGLAQYTDCWILVRKDLISGGWKQGYRHVIPGSGQLEDEMDLNGKQWAPKGLINAAFDCDALGARVNLGAAHYLTGARDPSSKFWKLNRDLGLEIGDWMQETAKGSDIAFYGGDQNMADQRNDQPQGDTFFGAPVTSAGDELKKWENTGHGPIDVIASYNKDGRVSALSTQVFNDREFPLHTDHFITEATYNVNPVKA